MLRAVRPTRHAEALRLRLFDLDIFRLGTAMMRSWALVLDVRRDLDVGADGHVGTTSAG
jgi:hypothetical protein